MRDKIQSNLPVLEFKIYLGSIWKESKFNEFLTRGKSRHSLLLDKSVVAEIDTEKLLYFRLGCCGETRNGS